MAGPVHDFDWWALWLGKIVAAGAAIGALWHGTKRGWRNCRASWRVIKDFANTGAALDRLSADLSVMRGRQAVIVETHAVPMWRTDAAGSCIDANAAYVRTFNVPLSEVLGSGWEGLLHPADAAGVAASWNEAVRERGNFVKNFRMRTNGKTYRVTAKAFPVRNHRGEIVEYSGVTTVHSVKDATADE